MDGQAPKEVRIPPIILPKTDNWDDWYRFVHEELIKHIERLNTQTDVFDLMAKTLTSSKDKDVGTYLGMMTQVLLQVNSLNALVNVTLEFDNELRKKMEEELNVLRQSASETKTELTALASNTSKTLKSIEDFVKRYGPLLNQLDSVGGGGHI